MRPPAPDLTLAPTVIQDEAEMTPAEHPLAKVVRAELERVSGRWIGMIAAEVVNAIRPELNQIRFAINALEGHVLKLEGRLDSADERARKLDERLSLLERTVRNYQTLPPPDGAE